MKIPALALVMLTVLAPAATAAPDSLGGYKLGQKAKKKKPADAQLWGCAGSVTPTVVKGKVVKVTFTPDPTGDCAEAEDPEAVRAAAKAEIDQATGVTSVDNEQGDTIWEGTTASLIMTTADYGPGGPMLFEVQLVPPGAGSKRPCWPDDGFKPFFAEVKAAIAAKKPAADFARFFKLPFHDLVGTYRDAKTFAKKADKGVLGEDNRTTIAEEERPYCRLDSGSYILLVDNMLLVARRAGDTWQFTGFEDRVMY